MNVLFLTLIDFNTFDDRNIYGDLLREFIKNGHDVYCISPIERRRKVSTHFEENGRIIKLKIGNVQKTNVIEKGISTLLIEQQYISAIKKYFSDISFDLVLYTTPPITLVGAVQYVKKRDNAKTYLMLKDIFPQNAVDIGMMSKNGLCGLIYRFFRYKEKKIYEISDRIGCMSQANVDYLLKHNPEIPKEQVEVCPNCIEVCDVRLSEYERMAMRCKYGLPQDKKLFVYGGNLGKPQDVPFIISCLKKCAEITDAYFVIAGSGTDRCLLEKYIKEENPPHVKFFEQLPKEEYERMIACCDLGLVFLNHRFMIPNFPSRILSYMQAGLPVLACTDPNTDVGKVIVAGGFGWWCESNDCETFCDNIKMLCHTDVTVQSEKASGVLKKYYSSDSVYRIIERFFD